MYRTRTEAEQISWPKHTTQQSASNVQVTPTHRPSEFSAGARVVARPQTQGVGALVDDDIRSVSSGQRARVEERPPTYRKRAQAPKVPIEREPLDFLKKHDVDGWKRWREEHRDVRPDLSGADLSNHDLREFDFNGVNLANANLSGAKLNGVNLQKANLKQANLSGADLSEAILQDVDLTKAIIVKKTNLNGADLTGANLSNANLRGALLRDARLDGATLTKADLSRADLTNASLPDADLGEAILRETHLDGAILTRAKLNGAFLIQAILPKAYLNNANLEGAILRGANLIQANLKQANLSKADLSEVIFYDVDLTKAVPQKADLTQADLTEAILSNVNLGGAILKEATLKETRLDGANLSRATLNRTSFLDVDLSETKGLETIDHQGSSIIDLDTIVRSQVNTQQIFFRRAGVPEIIIDTMLSRTNHPIKYQSCFISYSSKDHAFAEQLYTDLRRLGVRCWFAPEDLKIGEAFYSSICESIRGDDKLLLILSENSVKSSWVQKEVEVASQKDVQVGQSVLFPIRLDNTAQTTGKDWVAKIRSELHIGDFTRWQQPDAYLLALARLLQALKTDS